MSFHYRMDVGGKKRKLEELEDKNQELKDKNQELKEENQELKRRCAALVQEHERQRWQGKFEAMKEFNKELYEKHVFIDQDRGRVTGAPANNQEATPPAPPVNQEEN